MQEQTDYRQMLTNQLAEKRLLNKSYSLRAFARDLDISAGFLSQVLQGKKDLSNKTAHKIALRLYNENPQRKALFMTLVQRDVAQDPAVKEELNKKVSERFKTELKLEPLRLNIFASIGQWYHHALMALISCKNCPKTIPDFADRLKLDKESTSVALSRLTKMGMVQLTKDGWFLNKNHKSVATKVPNIYMRQFHQQMIKKALVALRFQSRDEREFGGVTMSIDPKKLPDFKKKLREFQRELLSMADEGDHSQVYQFNCQFFRIDQDHHKD